MRNLKLAVALILIVVVVIVILQNTDPVESKILFVTITMPRAALLGITMLIGVAAGILMSLGMSKKTEKKIKALDPTN